jgi:arabinogalactan endo-1,4-beta-galactosidase
MNDCEVVISVKKRNENEPYNTNFQAFCKNRVRYNVVSKSNPEYSFKCCQLHSNLFDERRWDFRRV